MSDFEQWLHRYYDDHFTSYSTYVRAYEAKRFDMEDIVSAEWFNSLETVFCKLGHDGQELVTWLLRHADRMRNILCELDMSGDDPIEDVNEFICYAMDSGLERDEIFGILFDDCYGCVVNRQSVRRLREALQNADENVWFFLKNVGVGSEEMFEYWVDGEMPEFEGAYYEDIFRMVKYAVQYNLQMQFCCDGDSMKHIVDPIDVISDADEQYALCCWEAKEGRVCHYKLDGMVHVQLCNTIQSHGLSRTAKEAYRAAQKANGYPV